MSNSSDICIKLDDRVRLMSSVLAATRYPEQAQAQRPHGTHAHARATRKQLAAYADHPAVQTLQALIDEGAALEAIFALALRLNLEDGTVDAPPSWEPPAWMPPGWDEALSDFYSTCGLAQWWQSENAVWQKNLGDATRTFEGVQIKPFLQPYLGEIHERLVFMPNIGYPTDQEMALRIGRDLVCIVPPRLAWGDSPPWPFDEDPAYLYRVALSGYGSLLMLAYLREHAAQITPTTLPVTEAFKALYPTWEEQFTGLFVGGAVAIYLEDHVSHAEANAYVLMERKVKGLEVLPGVIRVLRRYVTELESGRYKSLLDLLPHFAKQLRVANRIASL